MDAIPGYTIVRPLGRGGMAAVYLAVQESLGREVALKLLSPSPDDTAGERFLREARIAANLHHPNIVPIHDFGVHEGIAYIAMAYEPSGTISLNAGERLEPRTALRLARDIATALDYAHGRGVVHRDIKPDNILRRVDGAGVLSDFGIARLIKDESQLTVEGTSVGTPQYMSPEQLRGDKVDGRSDLYSLGVVLWQLLTGELPYQGKDGWAIGAQHLTADIPRLPPALSHVQGLLDALLAKNVGSRPSTGADVVRWIDRLLSTPAAPATTPNAHSLQHDRVTRMPLPWRTIGAVVLAALVVGWLGWRAFGSTALPGEGLPADSPPRAGAVAAVAAARKTASIAVLPLDDLSEARDQSHFSDGISDELSSRLAQVPGLRVAGRTSAKFFKGKGATLAQIGKALNVSSVLEGSVRMHGDRLRVTVQLIDVADGFQLWSQSYDRELTDIFAVQEEIASAIVESLQLKLLASSTTRRHVPGFEAYAQFLRGWQALDRNEYKVALAAFQQAVALDPGYAKAFAGLAIAQSFTASRRDGPIAYAEANARAMTSAERAVQLDPTLGFAYACRGYLRSREWDWDGALADTEKSLSLDPGEARNHLPRGMLLASLNRLDEARVILEQGTTIDPLAAPVWYWLARIRVAQGDFAGAHQAYDRVLDIDPKFLDRNNDLGMLALLEADAARARQLFLAAEDPIGVVMAEHGPGKSAQSAESMDRLAEANKDRANPYTLALGYAWIGEKSKAFEWLDRALETRNFGMQMVSHDPVLRSLHGDPRFDLLLKKLGLPERQQ